MDAHIWLNGLLVAQMLTSVAGLGRDHYQSTLHTISVNVIELVECHFHPLPYVDFLQSGIFLRLQMWSRPVTYWDAEEKQKQSAPWSRTTLKRVMHTSFSASTAMFILAPSFARGGGGVSCWLKALHIATQSFLRGNCGYSGSSPC